MEEENEIENLYFDSDDYEYSDNDSDGASDDDF